MTERRIEHGLKRHRLAVEIVLDDAVGQGALLCNMVAEARRSKS
jgi:hypothetical protein